MHGMLGMRGIIPTPRPNCHFLHYYSYFWDWRGSDPIQSHDAMHDEQADLASCAARKDVLLLYRHCELSGVEK
jgi:hypothetical protein